MVHPPYAKLFAFLTTGGLIILLLAACGPFQVHQATNQPVEVTREVHVTLPTVVVTVPVAVKYAEVGNTRQEVEAREKLVCGAEIETPGFGYLDPQSQKYSGFDIDYCRAIAAAIFNDPERFEIISSNDRFAPLQSGQIDVLIRVVTRTLSRDTAYKFNFAPTTFYDGQGILVRKDHQISHLQELDGSTICVVADANSEANMKIIMSTQNLTFELLRFATPDEELAAYEDGQCDAMTSDRAFLAGRRLLLKDPAAHQLLDDTLSKEPLGPVVRHGDDNWLEIVTWVTYCTIGAEELGITSQNVAMLQATSQDLNIRTMLGLEGNLGEAMGLTNDFCARVIQHVGNYAEIYNRNFGPNTPLNIPRGLNNLWRDGGLLYAPPFR